MSFYTGKGDQGYTDLLGGRVAKYEARPESYGTIDEATSQIGFARSIARSERTRSMLLDVQRDLYLMMAELAFTADIQQNRFHVQRSHLERIERWTDEVAAELDLPPEFIIPGDSTAGAALDVARTVIRRAERLVTKLFHDEDIANEVILAYLNRLSSLLFVLARDEDREAGAEWTKAKAREE
ncbi:MAG: cob(I)yrinic acid a,c-diamide adenosyltransferase [Chloroflexota bacterium]